MTLAKVKDVVDGVLTARQTYLALYGHKYEEFINQNIIWNL